MAKAQLLSIDDFGSIRGKTVIARIDVNSPVDPKTKKIGENARIKAHAKTLALLCTKGAKVIILAHQGRKGGDDFLPLAQHAKLLAKASGKPVAYAADPLVVGPKTLAAAKSLKPGQLLLLDNVRYLDEETDKMTPLEQAHGVLVSSLAPLADIYVDDAFSNAHRAHASITGFPQVLSSAAGPVMLSELDGARMAMEPAKRPNIYVLGGAKPEEVIGIIKHALSNSSVDKILTSGVIGELVVIARGSTLSADKMKWLAEKGYTSHLLALREVIHFYNEFIETPFDFAIKDPDGKRREVFLTALNRETAASGDIGHKTAAKYAKIVARARTLYVKGPCGIYEDPIFQEGTRTVFSAVAANQNAFSLVAGGNTSDAFSKLGIPTTNITHLSIGGGVLLDLMAGMKLPAVEALQQAAKEFGTKTGYRPPAPVPLPEPVHVPASHHRQAPAKLEAVATLPKPAKKPQKTALPAKPKLKATAKKPQKPTKKTKPKSKPKGKPKPKAKPKAKAKKKR